MVQVNTNQYRFSHGRDPRGTGLWMFQIGTEQFQYTGSYANAKKSAIAMARVRNEMQVTVLP